MEEISSKIHPAPAMNALLGSVIAALGTYGREAARADSESCITVPGFDDLAMTLELLARIASPLELERGLSPEETSGALHAAISAASPVIVRQLLGAISQYAPLESQSPQQYFLQLSESLIFEYLLAEFSGNALTPSSMGPAFDRLAQIIVAGGKYPDAKSSQRIEMCALAKIWASPTHRQQIVEKFWLSLPPREFSAVLRGADLWSVPIAAIRRTLSSLSAAGADAPRREARTILVNYARRLDHQDSRARYSVACGLNELTVIIESLWPNQLPADLSSGAMRALATEKSPETVVALSTFLDNLGRMAIHRADYSGFEAILIGLEESLNGTTQEHVTTLAHRLVSQDRWLLLVDAALAARHLDPALPRLLVRDPEKLLDRLTALLLEPRGAEMMPAMARLLRTIGVAVLNPLEMRLYEARIQRVTATIKLLSVTDPERLLRGLTRALATWEWNLQDLAVTELSRPSNAATAQGAAFVFSAILSEAHPLVVPMMIDQIGLAQEVAAIPQLMEIAAGENSTLRDLFVRIKAIEALGRMRALEAIELLRSISERRDGLTFAEPSGLRVAAHDALMLLEDRPESARIRAAFESSPQAGIHYTIPRRYTRLPLEVPLRAQIAGGQASMGKIRTIGLGGAYCDGKPPVS